MFKYLQSIFGKSSSSYESLMDSRDPAVAISQAALAEVVTALKPIVLEGYTILKSPKPELTFPQLPAGTAWPVNNKGELLLYLGTLENKNDAVNVFQHKDGRKKETSNLQLIHIPNYKSVELEELEPNSQDLIHSRPYNQEEIASLPIWEEIIHRHPAIHKMIVKLAPDHPWTLYKMAKNELCPVKGNESLGGYPQWIVNDIDYRKIKDLQFLVQIEGFNGTQIIYYFTDGKEIHEFSQAL